MLTALLTTFGVLPWLLLAARRQRGPVARDLPPRPDLLLRFCLVYGGISFAIAPMLGTWYSRLFGYGWPLALVAVPRLLWPAAEASTRVAGSRKLWGVLGVLHLLVCVVANREVSGAMLCSIAVLEAAAVALLLVQRRAPVESSPAA